MCFKKSTKNQKSQHKESKMQKGTGANERTNTDTLDPCDPFSSGLRRSMK